ncbi:MAG: c-type cytochrome [Chloroflexi bacterium]|nr:c-type cytochrome [Chloroflexota bacterium]MBI5080379.1 c-type cytochrome [Chloroflexota bacterium]MBI5348078.1 c-type cytochrome [Chloroflexota bacterium]
MVKKLTLSISVVIALCLISAGLVLAQTGDPKRGAQVYAQNCVVCHGPDGKGRIGANLSTTFGGINPKAFFEQVIAAGVANSPMPAWSQEKGGPLSKQDVADVAAYVAGLTGGTEPIAPAPSVAPLPITPAPGVVGDPSAGSVVFAQNCAVCHGAKGEGRIGVTLQKNWAGINPAAYIRSTVEKGVTGSAMPAWLNTSGGPLTSKDIDNVSAFILTALKTSGGATPTPAPVAGPIGFGAGMAILALVVVLLGAVAYGYYRRA